MKERRTYYCNHCKKPLDTSTDIVRFYKNALYHLECYVQFINKDKDFDSYACPSCHTTGKFWNKTFQKWVKCRLCSGSGFLVTLPSTNEDIIEEEKSIFP